MRLCSRETRPSPVRTGIQGRVETTRSPVRLPCAPIAQLADYPSRPRFPCNTSRQGSVVRERIPARLPLETSLQRVARSCVRPFQEDKSKRDCIELRDRNDRQLSCTKPRPDE